MRSLSWREVNQTSQSATQSLPQPSLSLLSLTLSLSLPSVCVWGCGIGAHVCVHVSVVFPKLANRTLCRGLGKDLLGFMATLYVRSTAQWYLADEYTSMSTCGPRRMYTESSPNMTGLPVITYLGFGGIPFQKQLQRCKPIMQDATWWHENGKCRRVWVEVCVCFGWRCGTGGWWKTWGWLWG